MIVHLDTSLLIDAFTGARRALPELMNVIGAREDVTFTTLALYEWLRGPRTPHEDRHLAMFATHRHLVPFGADEARTAATIYRQVRRSRQRAVDIAIAACAIEHGAALWTLNTSDFVDIPGLTLYDLH